LNKNKEMQKIGINYKIIKEEIAKEIGDKYVSDEKLERIINSIDIFEIEARKRKELKSDNFVNLVVHPANTEEIVKIVNIARKYNTPVIPFGAGGGVMGGIVPVYGGICIDLKRLNRIISIDEQSLLVSVQAGMNGGNLEERLNFHGYTLGHQPQSLYCSTVGGWVGHRAVGTFSTKYGDFDDLLISLEVVLPDGTVVRTKTVPKASTGININKLFIGSEGEIGIVTEVTQKIFHLPEIRIYQAVRMSNMKDSLEAIRTMIQTEIIPPVIRLYDEDESKKRFVKNGLEQNGCLLILVFEGQKELTTLQHNLGMKVLKTFGGEDLGPKASINWFKTRFDVTSIINWNLDPNHLAFTIEVAGTWTNAYELYRRIKSVIIKFSEVHCHFSHFYTTGAAMYFTLYSSLDNWDSPEQFYKEITTRALKECLAIGGTISHHHGIGLAYSKWLKQELSTTGYNVACTIKKAFDPLNIFNPGKLI